KRRRRYRNLTDRNRHRRRGLVAEAEIAGANHGVAVDARRRNSGSRRTEVVLQNAEIGLVDSRHAGKRRPTGGSGRVIVIAAARKADRIVFVVREEKQLVFL